MAMGFMKRARIRNGLVLAAAAVLLTACSSSAAPSTSSSATTSAPATTSIALSSTAASTSSSAPAASSSAPATSSSAAASTSAAEDSGEVSGAATVMTATGDLGTYLVAANGMTLYMFTPDTAGTSTCYDQCATAWPPLLVTGDPVAGAGIDDSLLTTVARTDGNTQVVYNNWPVYYYAKDTAAGQTTGQGVGTKWYVVDPDGAPIGMDAAATTS